MHRSNGGLRTNALGDVLKKGGQRRTGNLRSPRQVSERTWRKINFLRQTCAMSCRRVQVGNALEAPQWSGSTEGARIGMETSATSWLKRRRRGDWKASHP